MSQQIHFSSYTPAADIVVTAICLVMIILVAFSYISRTRSFKLFVSMVWLLLSAAWADILFYTLAAVPRDMRFSQTGPDVSMCRKMSATYLQGFKYSNPTPIVKLKDYLGKKAV